ncbi:MAG: hypothetical protein ACK5P7_13835 [Bdellovibrio sp.]
MKKMILSAALILVSSVAMAQQRIDLSSGSSARLNVGQSTIVTCEGAASVGQDNKCMISRNDFGRPEVTSGGKVVFTSSDLNEVIAMAKKLNEAGLCR